MSSGKRVTAPGPSGGDPPRQQSPARLPHLGAGQAAAQGASGRGTPAASPSTSRKKERRAKAVAAAAAAAAAAGGDEEETKEQSKLPRRPPRTSKSDAQASERAAAEQRRRADRAGRPGDSAAEEDEEGVEDDDDAAADAAAEPDNDEDDDERRDHEPAAGGDDAQYELEGTDDSSSQQRRDNERAIREEAAEQATIAANAKHRAELDSLRKALAAAMQRLEHVEASAAARTADAEHARMKAVKAAAYGNSPRPQPHAASSHAAGSSGSHIGSATAAAPLATVTTRVIKENVSRPDRLKLETISRSRVLETFFWEMQQYLAECGINVEADNDAAEAITRTTQNMEMDLSRVVSGYVADRAAAGLPAYSWAGFQAMMMSIYVSKGDQEKALEELKRLRQGAHETMSTFLVRVDVLRSRMGDHPARPTETGLLWDVINALDDAAYMFTKRNAKERYEAQGFRSYMDLRQFLENQANTEPKHPAIAAARGEGKRTAHVGAVASSSGTAAGGNAVGSVSTGTLKCHKCGGMGHYAADCRSEKELRTCHGCNKPGHLRRDCPDKKPAAVEGTPKNK